MGVSWEYVLSTRKLDEKTLESIIYKVDLRTVIKTQKLSLKFIFDNILKEDKSDMSVEESYITDEDIVKYQKYTFEEINNYRNNLLNQI